LSLAFAVAAITQFDADTRTLAINKSFETTSSMNQQAAASRKTRAEQETENEAKRLREQVDAALSVVAQHSPDEVQALQTAADRIERAARDLVDALRELAQQRRATEES
jgi:Xaa-Pro aminopeptidase